MRIATWNVNGIRARASQVAEWLSQEQPDIVCLQEIKALPGQVPELLLAPSDYWVKWHGGGGYSGVALLVRRSLSEQEPEWTHPSFDFENRIVAAKVGPLTAASVYVPNGGKDLQAKLTFLEELRQWTGALHAAGSGLALCGDLNVARADVDVHPKERKSNAIGQLPVERQLFTGLLEAGLCDVQRALHPDEEDLYTWWPPWRSMRQRNIGWRIDYVLASESLAAKARACGAARETGSSDHAPLMADFDL